MVRLGLALLLLFVALSVGSLIGYLSCGGRDDAPPTAVADGRFIRDLETRIREIERRMDRLEARCPEGYPEPKHIAPPESRQALETATPEDRTRTREEQKQEWLQRIWQAPTSPERLAVLRDGLAVIRAHSGPATVREFLEEIAHIANPASEEGIEATWQLAYEARRAGEHARSDDLLRGIERLVTPDSLLYADAQYDLAWNRRLAGDPSGAETLFRRAADAPGVKPQTRVASWYFLASLRGEAGDASGARENLEHIVEEGKRFPFDPGVAHYVGLAKKLLDASRDQGPDATPRRR